MAKFKKPDFIKYELQLTQKEAVLLREAVLQYATTKRGDYYKTLCCISDLLVEGIDED